MYSLDYLPVGPCLVDRFNDVKICITFIIYSTLESIIFQNYSVLGPNIGSKLCIRIVSFSLSIKLLLELTFIVILFSLPINK